MLAENLKISMSLKQPYVKTLISVCTPHTVREKTRKSQEEQLYHRCSTKEEREIPSQLEEECGADPLVHFQKEQMLAE
jgi:hypothetical protein